MLPVNAKQTQKAFLYDVICQQQYEIVLLIFHFIDQHIGKCPAFFK